MHELQTFSFRMMWPGLTILNSKSRHIIYMTRVGNWSLATPFPFSFSFFSYSFFNYKFRKATHAFKLGIIDKRWVTLDLQNLSRSQWAHKIYTTPGAQNLHEPIELTTTPKDIYLASPMKINAFSIASGTIFAFS